MNYIKLVFVIFCFSIFSCSKTDGISNGADLPIPGTHIPRWALWTQMIDRRVNYLTNENEIIEENILKINNQLLFSNNASFTRAPKSIVYENYSSPFSFQMIITELNKTIDKIKLEKCIIKNSNNEVRNILEIPIEDISIEFSWISYDGHRSWFPDIKEVNDNMEIEIDKNDDEYVNGIYFFFRNIPINYENDELVSIVYTFILYTNNNETIKIEHEIQYNRRIEELKMFHFIRNPVPGGKWREITMEEWKKYL